MIISFKRLITALAVILPAAALVTSPVMATTKHKAHHMSSHKSIAHKTTHTKKAVGPTSS